MIRTTVELAGPAAAINTLQTRGTSHSPTISQSAKDSPIFTAVEHTTPTMLSEAVEIAPSDSARAFQNRPGDVSRQTVIILDGKGREHVVEGCRIDLCSDYSLIAKSLARRLGLPTRPLLESESVTLHGLNGPEFNAVKFVDIEVSLPNLRVPLTPMTGVLVVKTEDIGLLLGYDAIENLDLLLPLREAMQSRSRVCERKTSGSSDVLTIFSSRSKEQIKRDQQWHSSRAMQFSQLDVVRNGYSSFGSTAPPGPSSSRSSTASSVPFSSTTVRSETVFSRTQTQTTCTSVFSDEIAEKTKQQ